MRISTNPELSGELCFALPGHHSHLRHIFLCFLYLFPFGLLAQTTLPPLQREQDCIGAIPLFASCAETKLEVIDVYTRAGRNPIREVNPNTSCISVGEVNSVWYKVRTESAGLLSFTLDPKDPTDNFDWAVYNLTNASCSEIFDRPELEVSCNSSSISGPTGPNGQAGEQFSSAISVQPGQTYAILVNHPTGASDGYTLDFTSTTADINDDQPLEITSAVYNCFGSPKVRITFSKELACDGIEAVDFFLEGQNLSADSVWSEACLNGKSSSNIFWFRLEEFPDLSQPNLQQATFRNPLRDLCGVLETPAPYSFDIRPSGLAGSGFDDVMIYSLKDTVCEEEIIELSTNYSQEPNLTFAWTKIDQPGNTFISNQPAAVVNPTENSVYQVRVSSFSTGCEDIAVKEILVRDTEDASFAISDSVLCNPGDSLTVTFTGDIPPTSNGSFGWILDDEVNVVFGSGIGPLTLNWPTPGLKEVAFFVDGPDCSDTVRKEILIGSPTSDFSLSSNTACAGETVEITFTGDGLEGDIYNWDFGTGATIISGSGRGPYQVAWSGEGNRTISLQVDAGDCASTITTQNINIIAQPDVSLPNVVEQCFINNSFSITALTSEPNLTYQWDLGAGANPADASTLVPEISFNYSSPGIKEVSLQVISASTGCTSRVATTSFEVIENPTSDFEISKLNPCLGECVSFTAEADSINRSFFWEFSEEASISSSINAIESCVTYDMPNQLALVKLTVSERGCSTTTERPLSITNDINLNLGADLLFCDNLEEVQINGAVSGPASIVAYDWECDQPDCGIQDENIANPFIAPQIDNLPASITYTLQLTDDRGCLSLRDTVVVELLPAPRLDAGTDTSFCQGEPGRILLGGPADDNQAPEPFQYNWLPAEGLSNSNVANPFARPDTTTLYTLVASSINGCQSNREPDSVNSVLVTVLETPIVTLTDDVDLCKGDTLTLFGAATGGENLTYTWTPTNTGFVENPASNITRVSPDFTTTYFLVARNGVCTSKADSITVSVSGVPTVSAGDDRAICLNESVQLNGRAVGDPNGDQFIYTWTPSRGLANSSDPRTIAQPDTSTTYKLSATSGAGCGSDTAEVTITVASTPIANIFLDDTTVCLGDTLLLSGLGEFTSTLPSSPLVYRWSPSTEIISSPFAEDIAMLPTQNTELVLTTSIAGNCPTSDTVQISVAPNVDVRILADTNRVCEGESINLQAFVSGSSAEYEWIPASDVIDGASATTLAFPTESKTFSVVATRGTCTDTATVDITVFPVPVSDYKFSEAQGCVGLEVFFEAENSAPASYIWDFGDGSPISNESSTSHIYTESGIFPVSLTVTGAGGCENSGISANVIVGDTSALEVISDPLPGSELFLPLANVSLSDVSSNGNTWFWDFGDGSSSPLMSPTYQYEQAGTYDITLAVTDALGCVRLWEGGPYIVREPELFIPDVFSPNDDGINDTYLIKYEGSESYLLEIVDRWGVRYFRSEVPGERWNGSSEQGGTASDGVYFYKLKVGAKVYTGNITLIR